MKKYITILFPLLFAISIFAQMPVSELSKKTHVRQLKEGVLLVQLPNSDKKIATLKARGNHKLAKIESQEIKKIREKIIAGFREDWDFSEILFFEAKDSREVFKLNFNYMIDLDLNPLKELPSFEHFYSVRYGPGNPNGEFYRYNGNGFQIRYIENGQLQTIKYDLFFNGNKNIFRLKNLFRKKNKAKKHYQISVLNQKLSNVKL